MLNIFNVSYATIATSSLGKIPSYYVSRASGSYELISVGEEVLIKTTLDVSSSAELTEFESVYKSLCTEVDSSDDAYILGHAANNIPLVRNRNADGITTITNEPRLGSELIIVTHNYANKTTWFGNSVRVEYETLIEGDGFNFASVNPYWLDMTHGRMFDEDAYCSEIDHGYSISVIINGVTASMRESFATTGGDYIVNYASGTVTFFNDQSGNAVEACYSYATNSTFTLLPEEGKFIDIESVEAQFSSDVVLHDTIDFEIWGYNPYDLPNKVLYLKTSYKSMQNFIDEAQGAYPVIPALGGDAGRGTSCAVYGFPFRYGTIRRLESISGIELRVKLRDDKEFGGELATATFYCTVRNM